MPTVLFCFHKAGVQGCAAIARLFVSHFPWSVFPVLYSLSEYRCWYATLKFVLYISSDYIQSPRKALSLLVFTPSMLLEYCHHPSHSKTNNLGALTQAAVPPLASVRRRNSPVLPSYACAPPLAHNASRALKLRYRVYCQEQCSAPTQRPGGEVE